MSLQHGKHARAYKQAFAFSSGRTSVRVLAVRQPVQPVTLTSRNKDPAAEILERTLQFALTRRLRAAGSISVHTNVTGFELLSGRFGGMSVSGHRWRTPLNLTADFIQVEVGELLIDYASLMLGKVALRNTPKGSTTISLNTQDLANFMVHPMMMKCASRAVKGLAFQFDRNKVDMGIDAATGLGWVLCEGVWAGNSQRYRVHMCIPTSAAAAVTGGAGGLKVVATRAAPAALLPGVHRPAVNQTSLASADSMDSEVMQGSRMAPQTGLGVPSGGPGSAASTVAAAADGGLAALSEDERAVSAGLEVLFGGLLLNLQGIELQKPRLVMRCKPSQQGGLSTRPGQPLMQRGPQQQQQGGAGVHGEVLLDISMQLQMRSIPPLNMSF